MFQDFIFWPVLRDAYFLIRRILFMKLKKFTNREIASGGILTAIALVLMFIETPLPLMPSFLKLDLSNIPALIGGFAFGPVIGLLIVLVKDIIHITITSTAFVGELADFIISGSFVFFASAIYSFKKTKKMAFFGMGLSVIIQVIVASVMNYFVLLPFYSKAYMPFDKIIELCSKINSLIVDKFTYVMYGVVPFNIIKGVLITLVTAIIYKHISRIIHK